MSTTPLAPAVAAPPATATPAATTSPAGTKQVVDSAPPATEPGAGTPAPLDLPELVPDASLTKPAAVALQAGHTSPDDPAEDLRKSETSTPPSAASVLAAGAGTASVGATDSNIDTAPTDTSIKPDVEVARKDAEHAVDTLAAEASTTTSFDEDLFDDFDFGSPPDDPNDSPAAPPAKSGSTLSAADHAILFTEPGSDGDAEQSKNDVLAAPAEDEVAQDYTVPDAVPVALEDDLAALAGAPPPRPALRALWTFAALVLLLLGGSQAAFVYRAEVMLAVPESTALFARVCEEIKCREDTPAVSAVQLLARDVRDHPQYREALLVNATIINNGERAEPYPIIELRLHNGVGELVGARRFAPAEYLDGSIALENGMTPAQPVFVVMELGGDATRATSFEFTFL